MTTPDLPNPQDNKLEILRRLPILASCTDEQFRLVAEHSRLVEYKKGECIYREGDLADAFYVVASGRLQIFSTVDGKKQVYTVLHNGDTFGEISLLTGETHSATIEALNDTLVLQLEKPAFEELINRIPSLVLHLSRLLSKRLRTKGQKPESVEATVVAVHSAAKGVGQTMFTVALATALRHETNGDVVVVDIGTPAGEVNPLLGPAQPAQSGPLTPRTWPAELTERDVLAHPLGFDYVYANPADSEHEAGAFIAPLISTLTKRYHYILLDLSLDLNATTLKALTQADQVYLITHAEKETVIRTSALVRQLRESVNLKDDHMRIVLNLMDCPGERMSPTEVAQCLGHPVNHLLPQFAGFPPHPDHEVLHGLFQHDFDSTYLLTMRRIARELAGMLVGLALGSGAALGLAHIGVIKVLERERIPIDLVAGSSVGALIAGLWASGQSAEELERMALRFKNTWDVQRLFLFDFSLPILSILLGTLSGIAMGWLAGFFAGFFFGIIVTVLLGLIMGPLVGGPIQGSQLMAKLESDFGGKTFEDTWLPLKVVATNPFAREEIVFESGSIAEAVRASVSIPGIFKPVTRMGKLCLDGGVANPIPVSVCRRAGATRVIAVNVFPTSLEIQAYQRDVQHRRAEWDAQLASRSFPVRLLARLKQELVRSVSPLVFDVIMRSMQSMEYQIGEIACRDANLTLRPTLAGSHWLEFYHPEKFIQRGEEEALRHLPEIKRLVGLASPSTAPAGFRSTSLTTRQDPGTIDKS